jgi:hypothetical protein
MGLYFVLLGCFPNFAMSSANLAELTRLLCLPTIFSGFLLVLAIGSA